MHLPVVTVRTPLQEERRSVRLGHRRPKPVRLNLRWRTLGVKLRLLVQLHLRMLKKSIVLEISGNGQVKGPSSHYHLPLPFVYRFPFLSA